MTDDVREALLALERRFWMEGAAFYEEHLIEGAQLVFAPPVGILDRRAAIAALAGAPRWVTVRFDGVQVVRIAADACALIYRASARRDGDDAPYEALASSVYVRRGGGWRLALHQQTPGAADHTARE